MIFLFENFAESRLVEAIAADSLLLRLPPSDAAKWPKPQGELERASVVLYDGVQAPEIVYITSNAGTGLVLVERGMEGTFAKPWLAGTAAINTPTKVSLNYLASGGTDSWHQELLDLINDANARITTETALRLGGDSALAEMIQTLSVEFGQNTASVQTLQQAYTDLAQTWAQFQVAVTAQAADAVAKATQSLNTSTTNGTAIAALETFIEAAVGDNAANFAQKIQALVDFDEAQVEINTNIGSRVGQAEASLSEEILLRSTQYTAQAVINTNVAAQVGDNTAGLAEEILIRAGADSALGSRASALEAEVENARGGQTSVGARINQVESVSASATNAVAGRTLVLEGQVQTPVSGLLARMTTEESVRASADMALATQASALEVSLRLTAAATLPSTFDRDGETWTQHWPNRPQDAPAITPGALNYTFPTILGVGKVMQIATVGSFFDFSPIGWMKVEANRRYRVTCKARVLSPITGSPQLRLYIVGYSGGPNDYPFNTGWDSETLVADQWRTVSGDTFEVNGSEFTSRGCAYIRPVGRAYTPGNTYQFQFLKLEDISDVYAVNARIGLEESVRASADSALASRALTLEGQVQTPTTGLLARMSAEELARASGDSALAVRSSLLEANATRAEDITPNGNFSQTNFTSGTAPPGWYSVLNIAMTARVSGKIGANAIRMDAPANTMVRFGMDSPTNFSAPAGPGWYVLEVVAELVSGSWKFCDVDLQIYTAGFAVLRKQVVIGFGVWPDDDTESVSIDGVVGKLARFSALFQMTDGAVTDRWQIQNNNGLVRYFSGPSVACSVTLHRSAVRRATPTEIEMRKARGGSASVGARVFAQEEASADLYGRTLARWAQGTSVPGAATFIYAQSENIPGQPPTSDVGFGGKVVAISNPTEDGGWRVAMATENGNTIFYGGVTAANFVRMDNGAFWYFAYRSQVFQKADGETFTFPNFGVAPQYEFLRDNLLLPNTGAGESYDLRLKNLTAGSATVWAKINVPGTPSAQSNGPTTTVQGSGPTLQLGVTAASKPESADGYYTVSGAVSGGVRIFGGVEDEEITVSGIVTVWAMKSGVWNAMASINWSFTDFYSNPGSSPITVTVSAPFSSLVQLGDNVASIGGTHASASGLSAAAIQTLSTAWSAPGSSSGTRSALAPGTKASIRIIPQG